MNLGFLLFLAFAVLLVLNGLRAFIRGFQASGKRGSSAATDFVTGVVCLLAAGGVAYMGHYMFQF